MSGADRSSSDLEVLRRSHRGKFVALAALLVGAGGFLWWRTRDKPIGNDEQPERVLVVPASHWRFKPYLEKWGFTAQEGRIETMVDELREKLPDSKETGLAAVLKLADWAGYAYVALEEPAKLDFSGLDIAGGVPTFEPHHRFAVLSAGDYAFPHKLTVNAKPSEVMNGPDYDLLSALFAQEPLASTLRDDPKNGPDIIVLRTKVQEGIDAYTSITDAEATIAKIGDKARALLVDKEKGKPVPGLLGGVHESLTPVALADGGTLLLTRKIHFSSSTGFNADLDLDRTWQFMYVPAGADPLTGRVPCTSLLGGTLDETGRRPSFRHSPRGDALLIHSDGQSQLFTLDPKGACNFTARGDLKVPLVRGEDPGEPHVSGKVARSRRDGGESVVYLAKPGDEVPEELARTPTYNFDMPAWLDDTTLAVPGHRRDNGEGGVFLLSSAHPDRALRIDAVNFDASSGIEEVAPAPAGPSGPRLLVRTWGDKGTRLFRVDIPRPLSDVFTAALDAAGKQPQPQAVKDGMEPLVAPVDVADWTFTALTHEIPVYNPVASSEFVTFTTDQEIAVVPLAGGPVRVLTGNELEDHSPMFSADGKTIIFRTRFPIEKTNWTLTTGRTLPVGG